MENTRLQKQIRFIVEVDKLKTIFRRSTLITQRDRRENDAEHSWHLTLAAVLLFEHAAEKDKVDLLHVLKMLILHDLVEIEAGDTYCYDEASVAGQHDREEQAANHLFSLLPNDQRVAFTALWQEFEAQQTPAARYAAVIDRIQPLLQIYYSDGNTWMENGIDLKRELARNQLLQEVTPALWEFACEIIHDAANKGWLKP